MTRSPSGDAVLDPDEVADYEAWKARRLEGSIDLSPHAYNTEMEANAISWEEGVRAMANYVTIEKPDARLNTIDVAEVMRTNPFRAKGMRGYRGEPDADVPAGGADPADQARADFES